MNELTFQFDCQTPLETFEWDRMWLEHTENTTAPRVLYIGDSISQATLSTVNKLAAGRVLFDGCHTSKGLDNPYLKPFIKYVAAQESHRELVVFNNGFHGWHLKDEEEYAPLLAETLTWLKNEFAGVPLAFVLTTHAEKPAWQARAKIRTEIGKRVAAELGVPVIDFYTPSLENKHLIKDGVHFHAEGYELLADLLLQHVSALLEGK